MYLSSFLPRYSRRQLIAMAVIFVAYCIATLIARYLFTAPAVIQPAAGIALAGLVLHGIALWPAIVAAAAFSMLTAGAPPVVALASVVGHTLHAVLGAYVLQRVGFDPVFRRVRDMFAFIFVALIASMLVPSSSLLGFYIHNLLLEPNISPMVTWVTWWGGIMIGDLVLASVLIRSIAKPSFRRTRTESFEVALAFILLATISYFLFWTPMSEQTNGLLVLAYLVPFVWFSLRLGIRFTLIAFLLTSVIGLTGAIYGDVPATTSLARRIITLEFFFATLAVIFYLFTAVMEERKRAARELNAQLERVKALLDKVQADDKAKNEFLAIFSHELRNPLAPIVSSLELLKLKLQGTARTEVREILDVMDDRVRTIVRLLDDLLDISRISQKKLHLRLERVDLRDIISRALQSAQLLAAKRQITLQSALPSHAVLLDADPVRLEQILLNLLSNAKKYTNPGGTVTVSVSVQNAETRISVKDTGIGIDPDLLQRIFEPFLQVETPRKQASVNEGLGIGLSLTKQLVEMHRGTIVARSEGLGRGSEFIVCLPLAEGVPVERAEVIALGPSSSSLRPHKTVLVVDDNTSAAQSLGKLLETLGHTLVYAENGVNAMARARDARPVVVVLDIGLPDFTGYEVAERLRENGFSGTLIALTGYGHEEDKRRALDAGFDHHLTKPIGLSQIQSVLAAA